MPERHSLRVLVVDDEPLGRERVTGLLEDEDDMEVVGTAECGHEAMEAIRSLRPELVFLDIQMPGLSGMDLLNRIGGEAMPLTIFMTAHEQYAVAAYRFEPVDYLLKPFSDERFKEAIEKARHRAELEGIYNLRSRLLALLDPRERLAVGTNPSPYLERIAVQMRGRMRVVPVDDIDCISASGVYAELHVGDTRFLVRTSLRTLEDQLDPEKFFRIHRSQIVRLDRVELLLRGGGGDYRVQLKSGMKLRVGRSRREELERRLGRL